MFAARWPTARGVSGGETGCGATCTLGASGGVGDSAGAGDVSNDPVGAGMEPGDIPEDDVSDSAGTIEVPRADPGNVECIKQPTQTTIADHRSIARQV